MSLISIVVPVYNEEENATRLYQELAAMADAHSLDCEFIFVDDGSVDQTVRTLVEASGGDPRVRIITFRRNFGQTPAMAAGIDYARGDVLVTLDGDLQNDPAEIPQMVRKLSEGYDLVCGWRKNRQDKAISRKLPSFIANRIISKATKVKLHDYGCTLKAMKTDLAKSLSMYGEMHRFIPALAAEHGVRIAEVPVNHRPRTAGKSKYGISRTFRVLLDLLTVKFFLGYSTRPLHMFGMFGFGSGGIGLLLTMWLFFERVVLDVPLGNRPLLLVAFVLILAGIQFVCFGLLAEILVRTYHESQNKKIYAVREIIEGGRVHPQEQTLSRRAIRVV